MTPLHAEVSHGLGARRGSARPRLTHIGSVATKLEAAGRGMITRLSLARFRLGVDRESEVPAAMLLRLDDPALVTDLCNHYSRSGFTAERVGGCMVEIHLSDAPTPGQERREILLHLRVWEALHPVAAVAAG